MPQTFYVSATASSYMANGSQSNPFARIQDAINAAKSGDTVLIADGTYKGAGNRDLSLAGKSLNIVSQNGSGKVIVDAEKAGGLLTIDGDAADGSVIRGITFRNAYVSHGGDWSSRAPFTISGGAKVAVENCVFTGNETRATYVTSGLQLINAENAEKLTLSNVLIDSNKIGGGGWTSVGGGNAMLVFGNADIFNSSITNNTLYSSVSSWGSYPGGLIWPVKLGANCTVSDSVVYGNSPSSIPVSRFETADVLINYNGEGGPLGAGSVTNSVIAGNVIAQTEANIFIDAPSNHPDIGYSAADLLTIYSSESRTLQFGEAHLVLTGSAAIDGTGNELDNSLTGNSAANLLSGLSGDDTLQGSGGDDTLLGGDGNDLLHAQEGLGGSKYEIVKASFSWDQAKADAEMRGGHLATVGSEQEWLKIRQILPETSAWLGATDVEQEGQWKWIDDTPWNYSNWNLGTGEPNGSTTENYLLASGGSEGFNNGWIDLGSWFGPLSYYVLETGALTGGSNSLSGGAGNDTLQGASGNDTLDGGAGIDSMVGCAGDDLYLVDSPSDVVAENSGEGTDTIRSTVSQTLSADLENLQLWGASAINGTGNATANELKGNAAANLLSGLGGNDVIQGGGGKDTLVGGDGNDLLTASSGIGTYQVIDGEFTWEEAKADAEARGGHLAAITSKEENDLIVSLKGERYAWIGGTDGREEGVWEWVTGEAFTYNNWWNTDGGNEPDNWNGNQDYLMFWGSDVWGDASPGYDENVHSYLLEFGAPVGDNSLVGGAGNDTLQGASGNDTLDGGLGVDSLLGGAGNDFYVVDVSGDVVLEKASEGADTVRSTVSYTLGTNLENLALSGALAINGVGNSLANVLGGNGASNQLDGRTGADTMRGGAGNDTYVVDNLGDTVVEVLGAGTDLVRSSLGYTLGAEVENLELLGSAAINGTGNALGNMLSGNVGANQLNGSAGADTLIGGAGNDTYLLDDVGDAVVELLAEGTDTVRSSVSHVLGANVENLALTGTAAINGSGNDVANVISGNGAANLISGGAGNDTLNAGLGVDTVRGGIGSDLLQIDWSSLAGASLTRTVRKDITGFSGSYTAKNASGQVLSSVAFDTIESLTLNGQAVDLNAAIATPGVIIRRTSTATATTEQGGTVQYSVALNKAPFEAVTLNFASSDLTEGQVVTPKLTFTALNWSTPQTLTIQGVDDYINDGNVAFTVNGTVATTDLTYNRITIPAINLLNNDDGQDNDRIIYGTDETDYLSGANGNDRMYGKGGQDQLSGGRGDDRVYGDQDDDRLFGELGNDKLYGGYDDDTLDGGDGADQLFGEQGLDTLIGGAGNDYLDGSIEADSMVGGAGNDTYLVDSAADRINDLGATTDVDTVLVLQAISYTLAANIENASINATGNANLTGNTLNNGLTGNDSTNVLDGGLGNDRLNGGGGADSLLGGIGNDAMAGGTGNDTMRGGDGVDLADFAAAGVDIRVDLTTGRATGDGTDLIFDIENILAGGGDDTLTGNALGNDLDGGAGIDALNGGLGNDTLAGCFYGANGGRAEIDTLAGGVGNDLFQLGWASGRFYDDGSAASAGRGDYVVISDFTVGQDRLQLDGAASNYYLGNSGVAGVSGVGLYAEQGATDELIAIIRGSTALTVSNTISTALFV